MVESKYPGANLSWMIGAQSSSASLLRDPQRERAIQARLAKRDADVEAICTDYGKAISKRLSVPTLGRGRTRGHSQRDGRVVRSPRRQCLCCEPFLAELSFCCKYGQKRTHEVCGEGCHYTGYLCYEVQTCPSNRLPISLRRYAQALAWLLRDSHVDLEHIRAVLPYTCAHRIQWRDEHEARDRREDALPIHRAREAVRRVFRRYTEQSDRIQSALIAANRMVNGEDVQPVQGEHPIYMEIMRDLGRECANRRI